MNQSNSTFIQVPLMRGFTEIAVLWELMGREQIKSMICGGWARYSCSQSPTPIEATDVDLFPQSEGESSKLKAALANVGFKIKHENDVAITYERLKEHSDPRWLVCPVIQIIKPVVKGAIVTVGAVEEVLNNFDFTVVRAAIISPTHGLIDEDFIEDDKSRKLRLKNIHCPISSLHRCIKYSKKGYWLSIAETIKLFQDWDSRTPEYRAELTTMIGKMTPEDGSEPTQEDIDQLEALLNVD